MTSKTSMAKPNGAVSWFTIAKAVLLVASTEGSAGGGISVGEGEGEAWLSAKLKTKNAKNISNAASFTISHLEL